MLAKGGRHHRGRPSVPARKRRVRPVWAGILLIAAAGVGTLIFELNSHVSTADALINSPCQNLAVPAYFYPNAGWTQADNSKPVPRIMILDPAGPGAGNSPEKGYQTAVRQAQAAGITILGYSDTNYTQRPATVVEADVRKYKAWYGVTNIFLDEVTSGSGQLAYYRQLADYVHSENPGSAVMLNPGTYPDQQYMSVGDIVMVFENTYASYVNLQVPSWAQKYKAGKFAYVIYAASGSQMDNAISLARRRHAGYVYVTDGTGAQRYDSLPSYWSHEASIISACANADPRSSGRAGS